MIQIPRIEFKTPEPAKLYNSLPIAITTNNKLPTNYYSLTLDQREFVDSILQSCVISLEEQIENYNDDLSYFEEGLNDSGCFDQE